MRRDPWHGTAQGPTGTWDKAEGGNGEKDVGMAAEAGMCRGEQRRAAEADWWRVWEMFRSTTLRSVRVIGEWVWQRCVITTKGYWRGGTRMEEGPMKIQTPLR